MEKELILKAGYRIEVVSWENDGDNYKTKYLTVPTLEEALRIKKICKELFCSAHNGENGVGNSMDGEEKDTLVDYYIDNKSLFPDLEKELDDLEDEDEISECISDYFTTLAYELMGGSEYYDFRVVESVKIHHIENDVFANKIE